MKLDITVLISLVSVIIAVLAFVMNNKRADTKDIETRVAHDTKVDMKLDEIGRGVNDIRYDITGIKKDLQTQGERISLVEKSVEKCHARLDVMDQWKESVEHE